MAGTDAANRSLTAAEQELIAKARAKAETLYRGELVGHHSCGASLAVTFNLSPRPYQALRRGGITGERFCGSIRAGELVLGEVLGDPAPTGGVTEALRAATVWYQQQIPHRFAPAADGGYTCNSLTEPHGEFMGAPRKSFCTSLTGEVAALTAEAIVRFAPEHTIEIEPVVSQPRED